MEPWTRHLKKGKKHDTFLNVSIRIVNLTSFSPQQKFLAQNMGSFFYTLIYSFFSSPPEQIVVCLDSKVTIT